MNRTSFEQLATSALLRTMPDLQKTSININIDH